MNIRVASVVIVTNTDNRVLVLKKNYGSYDWCLPGGKLEEGESMEEAAIRELYEETGISAYIEDLEFLGISTASIDNMIVGVYKLIPKIEKKGLLSNKITLSSEHCAASFSEKSYLMHHCTVLAGRTAEFIKLDKTL